MFLICSTPSYYALAERARNSIDRHGDLAVIQRYVEYRGSSHSWLMNTLGKVAAASEVVRSRAVVETVWLLDADMSWMGDDPASVAMRPLREDSEWSAFALESRTPGELCAGLVGFRGHAGVAIFETWAHMCEREMDDLARVPEEERPPGMPEQRSLAMAMAAFSAIAKVRVERPRFAVGERQLHAVPEDPGYADALWQHVPASRTLRFKIEEGS